jgi:hypothetical protein
LGVNPCGGAGHVSRCAVVARLCTPVGKSCRLLGTLPAMLQPHPTAAGAWCLVQRGCRGQVQPRMWAAKKCMSTGPAVRSCCTGDAAHGCHQVWSAVAVAGPGWRAPPGASWTRVLGRASPDAAATSRGCLPLSLYALYTTHNSTLNGGNEAAGGPTTEKVLGCQWWTGGWGWSFGTSGPRGARRDARGGTPTRLDAPRRA